MSTLSSDTDSDNNNDNNDNDNHYNDDNHSHDNHNDNQFFISGQIQQLVQMDLIVLASQCNV